eukprot:CAMPEP_0201552018 /NCGR_PEP_ID=MMETSP0173_2-20130828/12203_1 /ASSEMBLY_ACC=CAM_ASM_000268 /TAXON_ID=218659 /ORGANISM="Vexillifera sp., Strain DIVA3 564/2" /LENGTH=390 /DNA_ID=CAMNT_0047962409 /DNA_START=16 /DNA_END=1185 /DNA_ORIENTATION=+
MSATNRNQNSSEKIKDPKELAAMLGDQTDITMTIIGNVLDAHDGQVEDTVNHLLELTGDGVEKLDLNDSAAASLNFSSASKALTELERIQLERRRAEVAALREKQKPSSASDRSKELIEKEAELRLLELEIKKREQETKNAKQVVLYYEQDANRTLLEKNCSAIRDLLAKKGVTEMIVADASKHPDLKELVQDTDSFPCPLVVVHGSPVGDYDDLVRLDAVDKLDGLLEGSIRMSDIFIQNPNAPELQLGAVDSLLNAGESVVSGVGSILSLPVTLITWPFSSDSEQQKPDGDEFTVVHTNWYGRGLHRIFRLTDTHIQRVHPSSMEVRAQHPYTTVEKIVFTDPKNIIIHYNDNTYADYIRAPAKDVNRMVEIIIKNSTDLPKIENPDG